jgi:YesN/AraC family two-component response regulator
MMPGMNGFEVCKRLKQSVETRDIPVIFLTAMSETENILEGFESGSVDYVTKPFQASELLARVRTHLELKRAHDHEKLLVRELRAALEKVKTLSGLLPICACCKKIRNDDGYWDQLEFYIQQHSEAEFSHGLCPDCLRRTYKESGLELPPELQDDDS